MNYLNDPVECVCIDDSNKPNEIKSINWIKKGNKYHVIATFKVFFTGELGFMLAELSTECPEYPTYKASRFAFQVENLEKLTQLQTDDILKEIEQEEYAEV